MISSLRTQLSHIISTASSDKNTLSSIKSQLYQFNQFLSQQFIKLSAYYETKLEYQAAYYEQEISLLKQEIQRQYKVIELMKMELEDLVVLVNHQRGPQVLPADQNQLKQRKSVEDDQDTKEWRVKKDQDSKRWYQNEKNPTKNQITPQPNTQAVPTIFGLEVITEQETQRTLMSVCDEECNQNIGNDFNDFEDKQTEKIDEVVEISQQPSDNNLMLIQQSGQQQSNTDQKQTQKQQQKGGEVRQKRDAFVQVEPFEQNQFLSIEPISSTQNNQNFSFQKQQQQINDFQNQRFSTFQAHDQGVFEYDEFDENQQINQVYEQQAQGDFSREYIQSQTDSKSNKQHDYGQSLFGEYQTVNKLFDDQEQQGYDQSPKANIYFSKDPRTEGIKKKQICSVNNFVQNPFCKKKSSQPAMINDYKLSQSYTKLPPKHNQQLNKKEKQSNNFMELFKKSVVEKYHSYEAQRQIREERQNVMSILEMIAFKNNTSVVSDKKSQRQQKSKNQTSSRSRSKSKNNSKQKQSTESIRKGAKKRMSTQSKLYYHHTEERQQPDSECTTSMIRCPTTEDIDTMSQRYKHPQFFDFSTSQNHHTSNDNHSSEISENAFNSNQEKLKSLQTTFGRPVVFEFEKQPLSNNLNRENMIDLRPERKGSANSKKDNNFMFKDPKNSIYNNKQNQRQRRMSEKQVTNKNSFFGIPQLLQKKLSAKCFKKPNVNVEQSLSSVNTMLQSHLQNSNKFLVGSKKQEVKYDGERISSGSTTIRHGHGILFYSNGLIYEGEFKNNKRCGYGLLKFNHVQLYSGQWQNDELSGKGKIRNCAIINKKKKEMSENIQSSNNMNQMFTKWISYCGEFRSNRFEGEGTLYLQGGEKFVGWFRNGVVEGDGSLFRKNGEVENGKWKNNIMVERFETVWN